MNLELGYCLYRNQDISGAISQASKGLEGEKGTVAKHLLAQAVSLDEGLSFLKIERKLIQIDFFQIQCSTIALEITKRLQKSTKIS